MNGPLEVGTENAQRSQRGGNFLHQQVAAAIIDGSMYLYQQAEDKPRTERGLHMTMIGAISCGDGVVMLADAQETITDYAIWSVDKLKLAEINGVLRVAMVGAGVGETIDMIWEYVSSLWGGAGGPYFSGFVTGVPELSLPEWRARIIEIVREATEKAIVPWGNSASPVDLIWMVQAISPQGEQLMHPIQLFRTYGMNEVTIRRSYFGGNPIQLGRFLSEQYLNFHSTTDEGRALATYLLWEGKENDPTVGKRSDIAIFKRDGTASQIGYEEVSYWEDHFRVLKREMAMLPILSCAVGITRQLYDPHDRMERLNLVMNSLVKEQEKMRTGKRRPGRVDNALAPQIRQLCERQEKRKAKRLGLTRLEPPTDTTRGG